MTDGTLEYTASRYNAQPDELKMGIGNQGPRVINLAPLLTLGDVPFKGLMNDLMTLCKDKADAQIEIELAATLKPRNHTRLGFLQVRPRVVSDQPVEITRSTEGFCS